VNVVEAARRILRSRPIAELGRQLAGWPTTLVAGGALRDLLLGRTVHDLDLVVLGDGAAVAARIAETRRVRAFELGTPPHSVWRVVAPAGTIDVWQVEGSLELDVRRRDFTVNALMWRLPRGPLLDLTGGLDDLVAGRIRVVDPRNLDADPIRVLRGIRLLATHPELALTAATGDQLRRAAPGLGGSPPERVRSELEAILAAADPRRALAAGHRFGVLAALDPAWGAPRASRAATALAARLARLAHGPRGWLRSGAATAMATALAMPAAGPLQMWRGAAAAAALVRFGWSPRQAARLAGIGGLGRRLATGARRGEPGPLREAAATAGGLLDPTLALAIALSGTDATAVAALRRLRPWARRFTTRAALADGELVARVLALPPGPARAHWVRELRLAQARGEVRSRSGAVGWLRRHGSR